MSDPSNDIMTGFVDDLVARVLSGIGEEEVLSIFVGGSVAAGEEFLCRAGDEVEVYSDVDLYVVVDDAVDVQEARRRGRECAREVPLAGPGYKFYRSPDVGVYTFEDLASQPARPGTVGLDRRHRMCFGDATVPERAAKRIGSTIAPSEALYLLENRLGELAALEHELNRSGAGGSDGYYTFALGKAAMDAAGASFIVRGDYDPSRAQRIRNLDTLSEAAGVGGGWPAGALDLVRRCAGRMDKMPAPDWAVGVDPAGEASEVVSLLLDRWKVIAGSIQGGNEDDWSEQVLRRCRIGDYLGNFRQFRAMNARCGLIRRGAVAAGVHLSRYSPVDALRLAALMDYLGRRDADRPDVDRLVATLGTFLDRLTRECGFLEGPLLERTIDMYRAVQ